MQEEAVPGALREGPVAPGVAVAEERRVSPSDQPALQAARLHGGADERGCVHEGRISHCAAVLRAGTQKPCPDHQGGSMFASHRRGVLTGNLRLRDSAL